MIKNVLFKATYKIIIIMKVYNTIEIEEIYAHELSASIYKSLEVTQLWILNDLIVV